MAKSTFQIPVTFQVNGLMTVQAESLQEALQIACGDEPLPNHGDCYYVDDSFMVDRDEIMGLHDEEVVKQLSWKSIPNTHD